MGDDNDLHQGVIQEGNKQLDSVYTLKVELERICLWSEHGVEGNQGLWLNEQRMKLPCTNMGNTTKKQIGEGKLKKQFYTCLFLC